MPGQCGLLADEVVAGDVAPRVREAVDQRAVDRNDRDTVGEGKGLALLRGTEAVGRHEFIATIHELGLSRVHLCSRKSPQIRGKAVVVNGHCQFAQVNARDDRSGNVFAHVRAFC